MPGPTAQQSVIKDAVAIQQRLQHSFVFDGNNVVPTNTWGQKKRPILEDR